ncbi:MAG: bifunctional 3,4-dihydroxy-2-butanone-4-phosphate synthase/GTP cyclohydrolase II [Dehalococcoidia bacterium]|nr:bifunctional 3,4-dihydroxy-2-butanone-4-phosphate synthase/GTP cyclohydrolase II [Dehalococcoidia bacterium]HRC61858.1 bifunctional 3,4-dihydroxy-2-butanone-4-phosphate synthase/GTP cyclohydrolase II [Dehalococcoidia bacterium]
MDSPPRPDAELEPGLVPIEEAIEEFRQGRPVIIIDDKDRENEGDVCIPAEFCTAEMVNFMAMHARGLICVAMTGDRLDDLGLPLMTSRNSSPLGTAFTVSVEAREGVTTGISAADRARTIEVLIHPDSTSDDLTRPGHTFPLRARDGGVLVRAGQTEASIDLAKLAGRYPAAVICEVMAADGTMARLPDLIEFAAEHNLKIVSVNQIIAHRLRNERLVERVADSLMPTRYGEFRAIAYRTLIDTREHVAFVMGDVTPDEPVLARVHDQCVTGDVFGSLRCDCGEQLDKALRLVAEAGRGVVVYMDQEGRGIGLHNKIRAYHLQDGGLDTVEANEALGFPADKREYGIGMQILLDLGIRKMRLMTNNPIKRAGLEGFGLEVVERVPIEVTPNPHNVRYLRTKREKMGHLLDADGLG